MGTERLVQRRNVDEECGVGVDPQAGVVNELAEVPTSICGQLAHWNVAVVGVGPCSIIGPRVTLVQANIRAQAAFFLV